MVGLLALPLLGHPAHPIHYAGGSARGAGVAIVLGMFAPMIATLIMQPFVSKKGVKGSLGLLRSWRYYLAALVAPPVFVTMVVFIVQALGLGEFAWSQAGWIIYLTLLLKTLPNIPFTLGEEYGWRGYLLPRLRCFSGKLVASIHRAAKSFVLRGLCSVGAYLGTHIPVEHGREAVVNEEETRARPWETARRILQAAAVEARGRPGVYVSQEGVMQRANMLDTEHFRKIAEYLEERGWIAQADADYGVFVVTPSGLAEAIG